MTEKEALKLALEAFEAKGDAWIVLERKARAAIKEALAQQDVRDEIDRGAKTLRETYLAQPEQEQIQPDKVCIEDDGCPTEKAVLQQFWREHQKTQPEPVATVAEVHMSRYTIEWTNGPLPEGTKLYTTPPQHTWVGLTDEEFQYCVELKNPESIAEEVEAKLKEKNT